MRLSAGIPVAFRASICRTASAGVAVLLVVEASEIAALQQASCYSALQDGRVTEQVLIRHLNRVSALRTDLLHGAYNAANTKFKNDIKTESNCSPYLGRRWFQHPRAVAGKCQWCTANLERAKDELVS